MARIGSDVRLINAAEAELIENNGHIEIQGVAKRAGLSVGIAYHHFGSKTGLIAAVVDKFYGPLRDIMLGAAIPKSLPWAEREKERIRAFVSYHYDHPFAPLVVGRLGREPEVLDIEGAHMSALLEEGARNIAAGQKLGVVSSALDPKITVALLMGGFRQALVVALFATPRPSREALLDQIWTFSQGALGLPQQQQAQTEDSQHGSRA